MSEPAFSQAVWSSKNLGMRNLFALKADLKVKLQINVL